MKIKFFKKNIKMPEKGHISDSSIDLFIPNSFSLQPLETTTIELGIGINIPEGYAGVLCPRSSIAKKGLIIQPSIIDPDYSGEIHLIITNCSNCVVTIEKDVRLCSLAIYNVLNPYLEIVNELPSTYRKTNGLGSTGE